MQILYCVIRANKKHHPQTFLEGCKYEKKDKNKADNFINDGFD